VWRGHEEDGEIGFGSDAIENLADHLAGGMRGERVLREGGGKRHMDA
jgi:hypothetical protein